MADVDVNEDARSRVIRYLDDAWGVEKSLVAALDSMANELRDKDSQASQAFAMHRDLTHQQEERIEARIRALGEEPSGGKGFFGTMMSKLSEMMHRPHDDCDQVTQDLIKAYAVENFEMAMYQSLVTYASAVGDAETAALAQQHLQEEKQTADTVWSMIAPAAIRPAQAQGAYAGADTVTDRTIAA